MNDPKNNLHIFPASAYPNGDVSEIAPFLTATIGAHLAKRRQKFKREYPRVRMPPSEGSWTRGL